jgi:hypothetical protein
MYFMNEATLKVPGRITDRTVHRLVMPRPDNLSGRAMFKVTRWPVEPGADVEKLAEKTVREAARRFPRYRFLGQSRREIDGLPAVDVRFTRGGEGDEVYVRQAHVVVRGMWLVFAASGRLEARDVCDAAIERTIATFRARA